MDGLFQEMLGASNVDNHKNVEKMDCTCYRLCCGLVTIMCWKYNIYH